MGVVHEPDGGSDRLVDLTDRYGEAIEADFLRFYGRDLSDYLTGRRPVRQAIRLILMLPPESAFRARASVDPRNRPTSSREKKSEAWRQVYYQTSTEVLMDLWEIEAAKAAGGKKGGGNKRPRYPSPTRKK